MKTLLMFFKPNVMVVVLALLLLELVGANLKLSHLSTVYLPAAKNQRPQYDEGSVEQIAYDPVTKLIYVAGESVLHVVSASDPTNLKVEYTRYEYGMDFTDIDVCMDHVFVTVHDPQKPAGSVLRVYRSFEKNGQDPLQLVQEYTVGFLPDMLKVLENCRTVIIAEEAEAFSDKGKIVDPEGQIVIVHFPDGIELAKDKATVTFVGFGAFNDRLHDLKSSGVRFVYSGNNNKLSNDLEPEYIVVDEEENKAYIILQENNAVAELDLTRRNITSIRGLGYKQWGSLDASDKDGGIEITYWPIRAWYQPDSAKLHSWHGRKLLFTANEGAEKDYSWFDEIVRGGSISKSDLGPDIHPIVKSAISDETKLGRLQFSRYDGRDRYGKYNALYTFGGRSFSIWDLTPTGDKPAWSELPLVFDSGSQLEELTALHCPYLFNRKSEPDGRSDNKGPEPEALALAEIKDRLYIFVGIERPGIIVVYSLGRDVSRPRFETIHCGGIPDSSKTLKELFDDRKIYGVDPEDIRFYPEHKSPTGRPVLMVAGTVSGTVTLLDVNVTDDDSKDNPWWLSADQNESNELCRNASSAHGK